MSTEYPCRLCNLEVKNDDESVQCDLCDKWNDINCDSVSKQKYEKSKNDPSPWYCTLCTNEMPFSKMSNNDKKNLLYTIKPTPSSKNTSIKINSNQFFDDNENLISCDCYSIEEVNKPNTDKHDLYIVHLNISPPSSHIDDLKIYLSLLIACI